MKAGKFTSVSGEKKILVEIENNREKLILLTIFHDTYALEAFLKQNRTHLSARDNEPDFTHAEVKEVADKIYIAI